VTKQQAAELVLDSFKRAVIQELKLLELNCLGTRGRAKGR